MKERQVDPETPRVPKRDIYIYICSAQTGDRDHPWIVLRKPWIGRPSTVCAVNPWIAPRRRH